MQITNPPAVFALFALLGSIHAQQPEQAPSTKPSLGCDTKAIRWWTPGDFEAAQKKARATKRLLIIKGISFGVDAAGAACATKGRW